MTVLPEAVAIRVVIVEVPLIFNVPVPPLVSVPPPESAVPTVNVPLFV